MQLLEQYGEASGQIVNKAKSCIVLGAGAERRQQQLKQIIGMNVVHLPFVYLGIPIFKGKPSKRHLQASFDDIKNKREGCKGITLSITTSKGSHL